MAGVTLAAAERAVKQVIASGQIGSWKLNEELGAGGFGVTWLATKKGLDGSTVKAVIKLTQPELLVSRSEQEIQEGQRSFHKEFVILQSLSSPHIARLFDGGIQETKAGVDVPWLALERVQGTPLNEELNDGPLDEQHWLRLARDLFEALEEVHRVGLVHLDIKPANIVLRARGAVLIDFGIAAIRDEVPHEGISGTLGFMAPEQLDDRLDASDASASVDVFKAGVTLVLAAQRRLPWPLQQRETQADMRRRLAVQPDLSGLTKMQRQVVEPLLAFKPELRPSAGGARRAIERLLAGPPAAPAPIAESPQAPVGSFEPDQNAEPVQAPPPPPPAPAAQSPAPEARQAPPVAPPASGSPALEPMIAGGTLRDEGTPSHTRRNADLVTTIVLLGLGFFGMSLGVLLGTASALSPDFNAVAPGVVMAVSHVVLYGAALVFSVLRLRNRKVSFWIPLSAGAVASVIFLALAAAIGGMQQ